MDRENCIFDFNKKCTNCGNCEICDLDPNKKCDNCGECLERDGIDTRAIKINEIKEDKNFINKEDIEKVLKEDEKEFENETLDEENLANDYLDDYDDEFKENGMYAIENKENIKIQYIEDIDGLKELMEDESRLKRVAEEEFPGFIKIRKEK